MISLANYLVDELGAVSYFDLVMLLCNGTLALVIFCYLLFGKTARNRFYVLLGLLARYALAALYAVIAARTFFGWYLTPVEPSEVIVNLAMCCAVVLCRGDIGLLMRTLRQVREREQEAQF